MSNVIKLNSRSTKTNVKVSGYGTVIESQSESDLLKKQLEDYYSLGYREAQEKTRRDVEREYTDKLFRKYEEVYKILQQFDESFAEYEKSFEKLVIETAFEVAKKVVQREVSENTIINENVRFAINKIMGANEIRLKLNPADVEELNEATKKLIHGGSFNKIKIEPDERIELGGCLIETEIGNVDSRISTQLSEMQRQLEDSLIKKN
ncbi:MAG: FliH/SctL family protein [Ignavibacteriales bacterium]|nr:FliH/SctL family protein [Ignavibacteriales bacterium]